MTRLLIFALGVAVVLSGCHTPEGGSTNPHLNEGEQKVPGEFEGAGGQAELENEGPGVHQSTDTDDHTKNYSGTGSFPEEGGEQAETGANEQDDRMNQ